MAKKEIKENDRVQRLDGNGPLGIVKEVRTEVTASTSEAKEKGLIIQVAWDNGTNSCFSPEGLKVIQS